MAIIVEQQDPIIVLDNETEITIQTVSDSQLPGDYIVDHGLMTGLADDDHPQYLKRTETIPGQTAAEIKASYESNADTNVHTDAQVAKLATIETGATGDQTGAEIKTAYENEANTNAFTDAEKTKLADAVINANTTTAPMSFVIDEDTMVSNLDTKVPTQQSVKAYVDNAAPDAAGSRYGEIITSDGVSSGQYGQKVWKDIIGVYKEDISGPTRPTKATFIGADVDAWAFSVGDSIDYYFHIPHDYAVGTDLYIHVHWGHQGTGFTNTNPLIWDFEISYAKRTLGAPFSTFSAPVNLFIDSSDTINVDGAAIMNITNYPQYCHVVQEKKLSAVTPTAAQLDTDDIEVDGAIIVHTSPSATPTITGGVVNNPFLFFVDIHYQADMEGTKNKDPNFYV